MEGSMTSRARPIPEGYEHATPYLSIRDAASAIEFYRKAFGATELMRLTQPDGKIGHAEIKIGAAPIMLADEFPEMGFRGPLSLGGSPVTIHLYVEDVDAVARQAVAARPEMLRPRPGQVYRQPAGPPADPL